MNIRDLDLKHRRSGDESAHMPGLLFVPNLITLAAMAAGLTSIQYALGQQWRAAIVAILIAIILDFMDGAMARLLNAASDFGAQLDNLSDFLSFGVAPSILLHVWILAESGKFGWMATVVYAAATALRLARFATEQHTLPGWKQKFFSGVPSPAGAGLALFPVILWLQDSDFFSQFAYLSPLVAIWLMIVAALMISRIPTVSFKAIRVPSRLIMVALGGATLLIAALVNFPWPTLTVAGIAYLCSLPLTMFRYRRLEKRHAAEIIPHPSSL